MCIWSRNESQFLVGRGGGEGVDFLAFLAFNASSIGVADVRLFADASGCAHAFQTPFGHLRGAVDQVRQRGVATGQAVQLGSAFAEHFAIAALTLRLHGRLVQGDGDRSSDGRGVAVGGSDANALGVFQVSFLAEAADDALSGADRARVRVGARGRAGGAAGAEDFVVTAFLDWWEHHERRHRWDRVDLGALESIDTVTVVADVSFFAGAALDADEGAHGHAVVAGAVAAFALFEFLVVSALLRGRHHGFRGDFVDFGAIAGHDAFAVLAEVSLFASAAGDADAGADGVGLLAGAIAAFALTVFFIVAADRWRQRHGFGGGDSAGDRFNADAVFVFQVAGFAEAADDALESAEFGRVRLGAGRGAGGTARHEDFVFFAGRDLRWVGEEHVGLGSFALVGLDAKAVSVSQVSFLAEASDDAVLGADRAGMRVFAVRGAGGAAGVEFLVGWAFRDVVGQGELHGDFVVGSGIAFVREHAFALSVLQVSFLTETADDALKGTHFGFFRMGAVGDAGGSAGSEFLVQTALGVFRGHGKSRSGDSSANGANAEQQNESKAKGHR
jgi:hypothetical protein